MSTTRTQPAAPNNANTEPVYELGALLKDMYVGMGRADSGIVGGVLVRVDGAPIVEAGSNYPDVEGGEGGYLMVRIDSANDDNERDFAALVQHIIMDGLRDYAAKHPTPTAWA